MADSVSTRCRVGKPIFGESLMQVNDSLRRSSKEPGVGHERTID